MNTEYSLKPFVSIITPVYNIPKEKLAKTVQSVLSQTYDNFEYIIVDDGSKIPFSGIHTVIKDPRIKWLPLPKNRGVSIARNTGIKISKGDFIAFLDAGDWWDDRKLDLQINRFLTNTNAMWCYCDTYLSFNHDNRDILILRKACCRGDVFEKLLNKQVIVGSSSSVIVKRVVLDKVGFFSEKNIVEDWDMWIRISRKYLVDFVSEPLVYLDSSYSTGRSKNQEKKLLRRLNLLYEHKRELINRGLIERSISNYWILASRLNQYSGKPLASFKCASKAAKTNISIESLKRLFVSTLFLIIPIRNPLLFFKIKH
jgi:glycosyltransferase involved in cell wall biosynthesis